MRKLALSNARSTVINSFLGSNSFLLPIWQIFYTLQLGLTVTQAIIIYVSVWVTSGIANVTTGVWADKFGRLKLYRIGSLGQAACVLPFFFFRDFWVLLGVAILSGIMSSMLDGTLKVNVMDSYDKAGIDKKGFGKFNSNVTVAAYAGRVVSGVIGTWLYTIGAFLPLVMNFVFRVICYFRSFVMTEVRAEQATKKKHTEFIGEVFKYVWETKSVMRYLTIMLLACIASESIWTAFQPYLQFRRLPVEYFGIVIGLISASSALSAYLYRKIHTYFDWQQLYGLVLGLAMTGLFIARVPVVWVAPIVAIMVGFGFGLIGPIGQSVVRESVKSKYRSTVSSIRQLVYMSGYGMVSVTVGLYIDNFGTAKMIDIITIQTIVCLFVATLVMTQARRRGRPDLVRHQKA